MSAYFANALHFLVQVLIDFYTLLFILRFLLNCARADMHNPLTAFLRILTEPLLKPLRRWIPSWRMVDVPALLIMILLQALKLLTLSLLAGQTILPSPEGLSLLAIASLLRLVVHVYMFCILVQVLISWVAPYAHSLPLELIRQLTAPLMRRIQRLLPPIGGLDLSPMGALLLLYLLLLLVQTPLRDLGIALL